MNIAFTTAKKKLASLWFIFSGLLFLIMFIMSFDKLKNNLSDAWGWFFPNILPSLTLILTIFVIDIKKRQASRVVDTFYYRFALYLSIFYLFIILLILLSSGFGFNLLETMKASSIYLGPIQGLIGASLGLFFFKKD